MVSVKLASLFVFAAFVAGSFVASPELRAFAADSVFSADIVDGEVKTPDLATNAVTTAKIKDGEVKVADIGADAVGASELIGVSRLIFAECKFTDDTMRPPREFDPAFIGQQQPSFYDAHCSVPGTVAGDRVIVSRTTDFNCFDINGAYTTNGAVHIKGGNDCHVNAKLGTTWFSIIVFKK